MTGNLVRHWARTLSTLRARSQKLRRQDPGAGVPLGEILDESLDACDSILQDLAGAHLVCEQLRHEVQVEALTRQHLLDQLPLACVSTDEASVIHKANQPAADLFNVSTKHLRGRLLLHFSEDRVAFDRLLHELPLAGGQIEAFLPVRPRERGPFKMNALIVPETLSGQPSWLWFLRPVTADTDVPSTSSGSSYSAADLL